MTSINKLPLTITPGADSRAIRERKQKELFAKPIQVATVGYCGTCKTRYEGNHAQHNCNLCTS